jgi:hypothetical protein
MSLILNNPRAYFQNRPLPPHIARIRRCHTRTDSSLLDLRGPAFAAN